MLCLGSSLEGKFPNRNCQCSVELSPSFTASQHPRNPQNRIYTSHGGCTGEEDVYEGSLSRAGN